jgi:hypothetical protein
MFYKYEEEVNGWQVGNKISFSDGVTLSIDNKIEKDGWFWSDEPPAEYTELLEQQKNN